MTKHRGVCGIIIAPDGSVVATHSDFERHGPGGFSLREAQTIRVRDGLKRAFIRAFLFEGLYHKSRGYFCDQFWENAAEHGYHMETIPIGHDEATV